MSFIPICPQFIAHRHLVIGVYRSAAQNGKKIVLNKGVYMDKELNSLIGTELKSEMLDSHNDILRTNKLEKVTKLAISLNELDNSDNLKDWAAQKQLIYVLCYWP